MEGIYWEVHFNETFQAFFQQISYFRRGIREKTLDLQPPRGTHALKMNSHTLLDEEGWNKLQEKRMIRPRRTQKMWLASAANVANWQHENQSEVRRFRTQRLSACHLLSGVFHNWKRKRVQTWAAFQTTAPHLLPRSFHCHTPSAAAATQRPWHHLISEILAIFIGVKYRAVSTGFSAFSSSHIDISPLNCFWCEQQWTAFLCATEPSAWWETDNGISEYGFL